jgi:hypothetical protein
MNTYQIQKKIKTPIEAEGSFKIGDYQIEPYRETYQPDLLISREVVAENYIEAMKLFLIELEPIINSITVLTQTMVFPLGMGSMIAYRLNDNEDRVFFAQIANQTEIVGMPLMEETVKDAESLLNAKETIGLTYLREAINAFSATHKLAMLISAAEAFAGTGTTQGKCKKCEEPYEYSSTNKEALREIMGKELYREIYEKTRIRHKLAHGGDAEIPEAVEIGEKLYSRIITGYLKEKYQLESVQEITSAPRGFSFEYSRGGCKMLQQIMPILQQVESEWEAHEHKLFYFNDLPDAY